MSVLGTIKHLPRKCCTALRYCKNHGIHNTVLKIAEPIYRKRILSKLEHTPDFIAVSFILPVYNVEAYLEECLDSILAQTIPNFEVICVDDGSTDRSLEILTRYAQTDSRIKVLSQKNKYAGVARNLGMQHASGEYLLFLDSDDFIESDLLEQVYYQAAVHKADICLFGSNSFDNIEKTYAPMPGTLNIPFLPLKTPFSAKHCSSHLYAISTPCPWSKLFRRAFILDHKLEFMALKRTNDLFFVEAALSMAERITYHEGRFVNYRINTGTNLQSNNQDSIYNFYDALAQLQQFLKQQNLYSTFEKSFRNLALNVCMYNLGTIKSNEKRTELESRLLSEIFPTLDLVSLAKTDIFPYNTDNYNAYLKLTASD